MKKPIRYIATSLSALAVCFTAAAGNGVVTSVSLGAKYGNVFNTEKILSNFVVNNGHPVFSAEIGFATTPDCKNSGFAEILNYPTFGIGIDLCDYSHLQFKNNSRLGKIVDLYGFMEEDLLKTRFFSAGFIFDFGVGFNDCRYHPIYNPEQLLLGAPVSVYVAFGPRLSFRPVDQLEISLGGQWYHHSNGHTWMPNWGLNDLCVSSSVKYYFDKPHTEQVRKLSKRPKVPKGFIFNTFASTGFHASRSEFEAFNVRVPVVSEKQVSFPSRPRYGIGLEGEFRYCKMFSSGGVVDINYFTDARHLKKADEVLYGEEAAAKASYSPLNIGVGFIHEIHFNNISAFCGVSAYVFRKMGIHEDYALYQRAGMRFRFPRLNNLFLSWCIRAHRFNDADYFEFQLGLPLAGKT